MALPTPPDPDPYIAAPEPYTSAVLLRYQEHQGMLQAEDASAMLYMAERWIRLENTLDAQVRLLAFEINELKAMGEPVGINRLMQLERYQMLLDRLDVEMEQYNKWAGLEISRRQRYMAERGVDDGAEAIRMVIFEAGLGQGKFFNRLPVSAVENMVGMAGPGGPLGALLEEAAPLAAEGLTGALIEGVALGLPPGQTALRMFDGMSMGLERCILIARTEQLRSYREASRQQYQASGAVQSYERMCARQLNTCIPCLYLDGKTYPTNVLMEVHPNDRCVMIPHVAGALRIKRELGAEWFAKQDPEIQRQMLGEGRFKMYQQGIGLGDMTRIKSHPIWGQSPQLVPLSRLKEKFPEEAKAIEGIVEPADRTILSRMSTSEFNYAADPDRSLGGVNESYRVGIGGGEEAIVKPGAAFFWAQEPESEAFAFRVSEELGFGIVPPTVFREAGTYKLPNGDTAEVNASVQYWVKNGTLAKNFKEWDKLDERQFSQMVLMDVLTNNTDRHMANYIIDENYQIHAIDNGASFYNMEYDRWHQGAYQRAKLGWKMNVGDLHFNPDDLDALQDLIYNNPEFKKDFIDTFGLHVWEPLQNQADIIEKERDSLIAGQD